MVTEANVQLIIDNLFSGQSIPDGFAEELFDYIQRKFQQLGCCVLCTYPDVAMTYDFRNFMQQFPKLDCRCREVVIHSNGTIDFRKHHKNLYTITIYQAPVLPV